MTRDINKIKSVFKETIAGKKFLVVNRVIDLRASNQVF
jgi:hypothetical protein